MNDLDDGDLSTASQAGEPCRTPSPLEGASLASRILFTWPYPLLKLGSTRPLTEADLPALAEPDSAAHCREKFAALWKQEKERCKELQRKRRRRNTEKETQPSLFRAICLQYIKNTKVAQVLLVTTMGARIAQALSLGYLLDSLDDERDNSGYIWVGVLVVCGMIAFLCKQSMFFLTYRHGNQLRTGIIGCIFTKALTLPSIVNGNSHHHHGSDPKEDKKEKDTVKNSKNRQNHQLGGLGQSTNLASNDVERYIHSSVVGLYLIWVPLEALVILGVGLWTVGWAFAAGYGLLLLFGPLQIYLGHNFRLLRSAVAALTDQRVNAVSQTVKGVRVVKMNGWEQYFAEKIASLREREVRKILRASQHKATNEAMYFVSSVLVSAVIFTVHVAIGDVLSPKIVFTAISLLNLLQFTVAKHVPYAIMSVTESLVSSRRIQAFLEAREHQDTSSNACSSDSILTGGSLCTTPRDTLVDSKDMLCLRNVTCHWNQEALDEPVHEECIEARSTSPTRGTVALHELNLTLKTRQLYFVVGKVGSGKSALLQALAGELETSTGTLERHHSSLAYAQQDPWIMNGTLSENITLGLPYKEEWFARVVAACGLETDLDRFSGGKDTVVGDRGVQLSGGQRARISLARVLYRDTEVILLDDPMSAVDMRVGRWIFQKAIRELCVDRGKCVVLVTHQHQYVGDYPCIFMKDGIISCQGQLSECAKRGSLGACLPVEDGSDVDHESSHTDAEGAALSTDTQSDTTSKEGESDGKQDEANREERRTGLVQRQTWMSYLNALGGLSTGAILLAMFTVAQTASLFCIILFGKWGERSPEEQVSRCVTCCFSNVCCIHSRYMPAIVFRTEIIFMDRPCIWCCSH